MARVDPDAEMVMNVLLASARPMTTGRLLGAAKAYEALRSSRERVAAAGIDELAEIEARARALDDREPDKLDVVAAELERERTPDVRDLTAERFGRGGGRR
jgi:hypothetical protein